MFDLSESVVLITGGSRGIGFETAKAALRYKAAKLIIVARPSSKLDNSAAELIDLAGSKDRVYSVAADLNNPSGVAMVIDFLDSMSLEITHLVNNAGFTKPAHMRDVDVADFNRTLQVNLVSPFLLIQNILRLQSSLSTVVNIASTAGMTGRPGWSTYSASKAALIALTESLRAELAFEKINVVCLSPGRCATDLRKQLAPDEDPSTIMQPSQVAEVIMLYLSPLGRLIDSDNIVVRT